MPYCGWLRGSAPHSASRVPIWKGPKRSQVGSIVRVAGFSMATDNVDSAGEDADGDGACGFVGTDGGGGGGPTRMPKDGLVIDIVVVVECL